MTLTDQARADLHPYTREMAMIHRIFRRESRLMTTLVAAVPAGDTDRATVLAGAWHHYVLGLHVHHTGEDELLWPPLRPRLTPDEAGRLALMEAQHQALDEGLTRITALMERWTADPSEETRSALVAALRNHHDLLCAHLDAEESTVMPLVAAHIGPEQWRAVGERGLAETSRHRLMIALGAILENASASERAEFLGRLPLPARLLWRLAGQRQYRREMHRVRGALAEAPPAGAAAGPTADAVASAPAGPAQRPGASGP
ncbi:hemerythrin domain-containing protein [Kitasatospora sp. NPDC059973]|uniref:hemerythrin domain-containing protein n=1 Tax=Kitasatospora sp. NPDC059973 TaxID=3347020 RepID=UPI0036752CF9